MEERGKLSLTKGKKTKAEKCKKEKQQGWGPEWWPEWEGGGPNLKKVWAKGWRGEGGWWERRRRMREGREVVSEGKVGGGRVNRFCLAKPTPKMFDRLWPTLIDPF